MAIGVAHVASALNISLYLAFSLEDKPKIFVAAAN